MIYVSTVRTYIDTYMCTYIRSAIPAVTPVSRYTKVTNYGIIIIIIIIITVKFLSER